MSDSSPAASSSAESPHASGFPWLAFLAAAGALLSGHWLASVLYDAATGGGVPPFNSGIAAVLSLACATAAAHALRQRHHATPRPRAMRERAAQFGLGVLVLLFATWAALAGEHWLASGPLHLHGSPVIFILGSSVALLLSTAWLSRLQFVHERPIDIEPKAAPAPADQLQPAVINPHDSPARALILFVSTPFPPPQSADDGRWRIGKCTIPGTSLENDIDALSFENSGVRWNWQQLLRALKPHPQLEHLVLVASPQSATHLPMCAAILRRYLDAGTNRTVLHIDVPPVDFENFNRLVTTLRAIVRDRLAGIPPRDILVDVTGGKKVTSIAGAALTLGNELRCQYVQTDDVPEPIVLRYDLVAEYLPSLHGPHS